MPEGTKEAVRARLDEEIKKIEDAEVYDRLSEEDRRALELGRKVLQEEKEKEKGKEEKAFEGKTREASPPAQTGVYCGGCSSGGQRLRSASAQWADRSAWCGW